jgi:hypothetical protein
MVMFYNASQPSNIRDSYSQHSQVDWLIRQVPGREIVAGSFRMTGNLTVTKTVPAAPATPVPIVLEDNVFINPYAGMNVFISNVATSINDRVIESLAQYPRICAMDTQARHTLEELTCSTESASELKGNNGNVILCKPNAPFSFSPNICLNKTSDNLGSSKYTFCKIMMTLSSALEALYVSTPIPGGSPPIASLNFSLTNLQLHWTETLEMKNPNPVVFNINYLVTQTVLSSNSNLNVVAPNPYDSVSVSFIRQANRNNLYYDSNMCEYLRDIQRVEFTINNAAYGPLTYAIGAGASPPYQDIAINYLKSLNGDPDKNSIVNRLLQENGCFGMGMAYSSAQNDKLGIALTLSSTSDFQISSNPFDACIYINGYLAL